MYATVLPPHAKIASIRFLMHAPTPTGILTLTCGQPGPTSKRCGDVGPIDRSVAEAATPPTGHTRCQGPSPASQLPARQTATAANVDHLLRHSAGSASSQHSAGLLQWRVTGVPSCTTQTVCSLELLTWRPPQNKPRFPVPDRLHPARVTVCMYRDTTHTVAKSRRHVVTGDRTEEGRPTHDTHQQRRTGTQSASPHHGRNRTENHDTKHNGHLRLNGRLRNHTC